MRGDTQQVRRAVRDHGPLIEGVLCLLGIEQVEVSEEGLQWLAHRHGPPPEGAVITKEKSDA